MLLAGLDLGTTGLKINVFENNVLKQSFYKAYPSSRQKNEQIIDIEALRNAFFDTLKEILATYPDLYALGITSFGEAFVLLDKDDNILYDCMLYSDPRGTLEAKEIKEQLGDEYLCQVTGQSSNMMFSINKIAYVKKNHPEMFAKVDKILLI